MLKKLRDILNTYTDEELEELELWVNSGEYVKNIIIDEISIDLILDNAEVKVNDRITKETK